MMTLKSVEELGGYSVIYADPPWQYDNAGGRGAAENHYSTMTPEAVKALPVGRLAADNALLFMWATWPNLPVALEVIAAWGFTYKTLGFIWVKRNKKAGTPFWGCGSWSRANTEPCLLAVRGKPSRASKGVHQLIEVDTVLDAYVGEHSTKPAIVRDRIVELCGPLPRIELFARTTVNGWDAWGDEVENSVDMTEDST